MFNIIIRFPPPRMLLRWELWDGGLCYTFPAHGQASTYRQQAKRIQGHLPLPAASHWGQLQVGVQPLSMRIQAMHWGEATRCLSTSTSSDSEDVSQKPNLNSWRKYYQGLCLTHFCSQLLLMALKPLTYLNDGFLSWYVTPSVSAPLGVSSASRFISVNEKQAYVGLTWPLNI